MYKFEVLIPVLEVWVLNIGYLTFECLLPCLSATYEYICEVQLM